MAATKLSSAAGRVADALLDFVPVLPPFIFPEPFFEDAPSVTAATRIAARGVALPAPPATETPESIPRAEPERGPVVLEAAARPARDRLPLAATAALTAVFPPLAEIDFTAVCLAGESVRGLTDPVAGFRAPVEDAAAMPLDFDVDAVRDGCLLFFGVPLARPLAVLAVWSLRDGM